MSGISNSDLYSVLLSGSTAITSSPSTLALCRNTTVQGTQPSVPSGAKRVVSSSSVASLTVSDPP